MNTPLFNILICLLLSVTYFAATAQTTDEDQQLRQKMQSAVMQVYDQHLAQNPADYNTRFARANQLYYNGDYDKALSDAKIVVDQIPQKEADLKVETLLLMARVYDYQKKYEDEIQALRQAMDINPKSLAVIDMLGKASYNVKDYTAAERNFRLILRDSPMNYDAMYWMGKVEVKRYNFPEAAAWANKAVSLFTAEPQVYINRADILNEMQQYEPAAQDLISAMSVGNDDGRSLRALFAMSDTHYDEVMKALASSSDKAPQVGLFPYLRAQIAIKHQHYAQALHDLRVILAGDLYNYHTIEYNTARCLFNLTEYAEANKYIDLAIAKAGQPMPEYLVLKAQTERCLKNEVKAIENLDKALAVDPVNEDAILTKARLLIDKRKDRDAVDLLDRLLAAQPGNAQGLLLRGWINKYRLNQAALANADFTNAAAADDQIFNLRGFALHELGRDTDARAWAQQIITDGILPGGECYIIAAALLSDILGYDDNDKKTNANPAKYNYGDITQTLNYLRSALANGYGNRHELLNNEDPYVNLKLARRLPEFQTIIDQNANNFIERR